MAAAARFKLDLPRRPRSPPRPCPPAISFSLAPLAACFMPPERVRLRWNQLSIAQRTAFVWASAEHVYETACPGAPLQIDRTARLARGREIQRQYAHRPPLPSPFFVASKAIDRCAFRASRRCPE